MVDRGREGVTQYKGPSPDGLGATVRNSSASPASDSPVLGSRSARFSDVVRDRVSPARDAGVGASGGPELGL